MPNNKLIIKILLLFGLQILFTLKMLSQDSIFFRDNIPLSAKVIEVNNTHVKYYREGNTSGPLYVVLKNTIAFIKYADNYIDSFSIVTLNTEVSNYLKLDIRGGNIYCNKEKINDAALRELLEQIKDTLIRNKLIDEFDDMKRYQRKHFTHLLVGTGVFAGSLFYGLIFGTISNSIETFAAFAAAGTLVFVPAMISSTKNKNRYFMKMKILVNNYNQLK
ncbi:MAG: hypothetical protein H0W73_07930 [Bacteroidetes bacterium]|nr:hypothetical protein [Bacteroidota bacterium]